MARAHRAPMRAQIFRGNVLKGRQTHLERQNRLWTPPVAMAMPPLSGGLCNRQPRPEARRHDAPRLAAGLNVSLCSQQGISGLYGSSRQT